ncbi:MAG TPA: cation:proton antiporter [Solirubrobacteraceae bacterium]|nr:cation:proton antiporter [Solirubrobacteraceae bacterium]
MQAATNSISPETLLAIMAAVALAGSLAAIAGRAGIIVPVVVAELLFGILLGPHVLGFQVSTTVLLFKNLGLGLLFFFAGYEIDPRRIAGRPLRLGLLGWGMSLVLAFAAVALLRSAGVAVSVLYSAPAVATTAIGTLIPVLSDAGELDTPFGTYLLAAGAVAEFGPILLLTLALSTQSSVHNGLILLVFLAVTVAVGVLTVKARGPALLWFEHTLEASSQLAVRWVLVLLFGLAFLAYRLGLDLLLGGFAAGVIVRELMRGRELLVLDSKLAGIAFGLFVPVFFVVSGMTLDISAFASAGGILRTGLFCVLMLFVRGTPALLLYRRDLDAPGRRALALLSSTQLPLVLAITALASAGGQLSASIAADLVGAAVLSTLVFPLLGLRIRRALPAQPATARAQPSVAIIRFMR